MARNAKATKPGNSLSRDRDPRARLVPRLCGSLLNVRTSYRAWWLCYETSNCPRYGLIARPALLPTPVSFHFQAFLSIGSLIACSYFQFWYAGCYLLIEKHRVAVR